MPQIMEVARHVAGFPQHILGTYAMGDQSDIVGYLVNQQLVQTEGLMMDAHICKRYASRNLKGALQRYNARY